MPKKVIDEADRKYTVPIALPQRYVDFINTEPGNNFSERIRSVIASAIEERDFVVRFDEKEIEQGNYEPAFAKDGAFCIFQKTESSREFGDDLPVKITKKEKPSELKEIFEAVGYQVTVIQYDAVGFISVWAVKAGSRCMRCREALKAKVLEVLCS